MHPVPRHSDLVHTDPVHTDLVHTDPVHTDPMVAVDLSPRPLAGPRFTGAVSGADFVPVSDPRLHAFVVTFEAGGRTAWHSHAHGQLLICTAGHGVVGTRDGTLLELTPGGSVWTEPGVEHWHGAGPDGPMTHVAVQTREPDDAGVRWVEPAPPQRDPSVPITSTSGVSS